MAARIKHGTKPDFDEVQGVMGEAIDQGYKYLRDDDLAAIANYVMSLTPIDNLVPTKGGAPKSGFE